MAQIMRDKAAATKFQILVEVAAARLNIQQKDIARRLNITPQAVSQYMEELVKDGLVASDGRSKYSVTRDGIDWVLKMFRDLQGYSDFVTRTVTNITVSTAVADCDLSPGQEVGLEMKDGRLLATGAVGSGAKGIAISEARQGGDVGIASIEGIVPLDIGAVTILEVPGIGKGGSRKVDLARLKKEISGKKFVGAIGVESLVALELIGSINHYCYGVREAVVEAAFCGLPPVVVCVDNEIPGLLQRLVDERLDYQLLDLTEVESPQ